MMHQTLRCKPGWGYGEVSGQGGVSGKIRTLVPV